MSRQAPSISPHGLVRVLRDRWLTVMATAVMVILAAVVLAMRTPPLYQASTTLFVSTRGGSNVSDVYEGGLFSEQRVASYAELINDDTLALRTIAKLGLPITIAEWKDKVTAGAKPNTILIDVRVRDTSPARARDIANTLSDEFVVMAGELETARPGDAPVTRVIVAKRAALPDEPVVRQPRRNAAIGLALGLLLGTALALVRDRRDNTIKTGGEVEEITGANLIADIPFDRQLQKHRRISFGGERSATVEAFRSLRANLQFLQVDDPPRVLAVTSSQSGEGKSTTAANLALALAHSGKAVALVDGDLRHPDLHNLFGLDNSVGLSNVVAHQGGLDEALRATDFAGLFVLTSGVLPPNPAEVIASSATANLLAELRSRFDYVIVDSSPLLEISDAAVIAADADGVLIVSRVGATRRDQLAHAVRRLRNVGAHVLGAVLTDIPGRREAAKRGSIPLWRRIVPPAPERR